MSTKKEKNFEKLKSKYENKTLTSDEVKKIPPAIKLKYCRDVVEAKYGVKLSSGVCGTCTKVAAFSTDKSECVSDDEICALGFRHS